ncbi:MAG: DUF2271 domain-containing protein [Salibacteraceae bacterium]
MMTFFLRRVSLAALIVALFGFIPASETANYKCMIQLKNYTGEGAYVIVSLMDKDGSYNQTLYVQGKDHEWYNEIGEWWKFYGRRRPNIDGITGATVGGGERSVCVLNIPKDKINAGYSLRFETAVEDQEYYPADIQFPLTTENLQKKAEGTGFIRYVRILAQ